MVLFHKGFTFKYSGPKKSTLASDQRYFCLVTAPKHGLVMGSIVLFGLSEPKLSSVLAKIKAEANFHISVGNVK